MSVTYRDILSAAERIASGVHRTPVLTSNLLNEIAGCELYFKSEHLQKAGAFKARGAVNAVFALSEEELDRGVATHSSGNHGAALARAASLKGASAYIVVPSNARKVKQEAIAGYGGEVILCEPTLSAREARLQQVIEETGATFIHPYDSPWIIAGQGTAALELVEQVPGLETLVAPVGGGGMLAGSALVCEQTGVTIFGAEPRGADDTYRSFITGERVTSHVPDTICDGLLTTVGEQNFAIIQRLVSDVLLASDTETVEAMRLVWTRIKQLIEPSSAVALAVILANPEVFADQKVGVMVTGGNVDLEDLPF